jgi:protein-arginine kinase activator protein McsA
VENTNVEENLVLWVSSQVDSEQYGVAECYDRMWDELINAVIRRRESDTEEHLRLLDWMRVKEENMEK